MFDRQIPCSVFTILPMKKLKLMSESVTETGGVFEDIGAVQELKSAVSNTELYFTEEESVQYTGTGHERTDVPSETRKS